MAESKGRAWSVTRLSLVFSAAVVVAFSLSALISSHAGADDPAVIRVNDAGQTYGSDMWVKSFDDTPDLIAVEATNGKQGYVLREDLYEEPPGSPEEAVARTKADYDESVDGVVRTIEVVESDGVTVVGEFEILLAKDPRS